MVAGLILALVVCLAYIANTWATTAALREENAALRAVLMRRSGSWYEVPNHAYAKPRPTLDTLPCVAPPLEHADKTDPRVMVIE